MNPKPGWQLTCRHPDHNAGSARCTKSENLTEELGGEDGTLRRLKYWALLGSPLSSKKEHKDKWKFVTDAWAANEVPSLAELDMQAPLVGADNKRRRL